jgi:hypothetical protein
MSARVFFRVCAGGIRILKTGLSELRKLLVFDPCLILKQVTCIKRLKSLEIIFKITYLRIQTPFIIFFYYANLQFLRLHKFSNEKCCLYEMTTLIL